MWRRRTFLGALLASTPAIALAGPQPRTPVQPTLGRPFVLVVDPGHGGDNAGCLAFDGAALEKQVTLLMALELEAELARRLPHARVVLTREDDTGLPLQRRVEIANAVEADAFISLHANASPDATQQGFETYVLDAKASGLEAARTARRENDDALADPGSGDAEPEAAMMVRQLQLTAQRAAAARFAQKIQLAQAVRFPDRIDRGVKQGPFDVLMGARMPAVLFEAAFLDHASEGKLLREDETRTLVVEGLAEAVVEHYRELARY
jgi:N-acetylmuramoyl-L-alanine amidase